jgi:hypothetical protein
MTSQKTTTWVLAAVVLAATLLALADTGYAADRGRDRGRQTASALRDGRRDSDRSPQRNGRDFDRGRITSRPPWGRYDRNMYFYRPPVQPVRVVYLVPVQTFSCYQILFGSPYVSFGFAGRW